jgi:hypothetical protein
MHGSTLARSLMVSVALAFAGSAMAQSTDKDRSAASKQSTAKPTAKAAPAPKRLDFVPGASVKETATRSSTPSRSEPARSPGKQGSECGGSQEMDA